MTTYAVGSGTYTFGMSASDLVSASLRQTGRFGATDVPSAADTANCLQALNLIIKAMVKNQKPLWCIQTVTVPLVQGQTTYNLSTITGETRPLRILQGYIRNSTGQDVMLQPISRSDYDTLGYKASQGIPNSYYYDPQLAAGTLYLYNTPVDAQHTVYLDIQRQIQDLNLLTDNPDFPQEAFLMLKWMLTREIMLEYLVPAQMQQVIAANAKMYYDDFFAEEREEVSTTFTPSERMM